MSNNSGSARPDGGLLVTWIDVARRLLAIERTDPSWVEKPSGLTRIRVNWDEILLSVEDPDVDASKALLWLSKLLFAVTIVTEPDENGIREGAILLDAPKSRELLPVVFERAKSSYGASRTSLGSIEGLIELGNQSEIKKFNRPVPVLACHSVKGGTGRTTTAVGLASLWAKRDGGSILLVDADLEAPGLSYLFRATRPEAEVSLEDLIALAHSDLDPSLQETVQWAAERLKSHKVGNLVILPLRRDLDELASSAIRSEHLASPERPYRFADLLAQVAYAAGCVGVVVDVRAGLVPVAAQLILDPNVPRVLLTSLASQSLESTAALIKFVAREFRRSNLDATPPLIVVNRIPSVLREYGQDDRILAPTLEKIEESLLADRTQEVAADSPVFDDAFALDPYYVLKLGEIADLQVPSSRWEGFSEQLANSGFLTRLEAGASEWLEFVLPKRQVGQIETVDLVKATITVTPDLARKSLGQFAANLVAAELADKPVDAPLFTGPMRALAMDSAQPPVVVCEGAKGTGKTLTARYLLGKENWQGVVAQILGVSASFNALFLPVLGSIQTSEKYLEEINLQRRRVAVSIEAGEPQSANDTRAYIQEKIRLKDSAINWTEIWLNCIAWSAGFQVGNVGAGLAFLGDLRKRQVRLIVVIEGVEEIYLTASDQSVPLMLRALLIDVPLKLRSEPGRPLGLIIFARRDTVDAGIAQNRMQFRTQYQDYALTWNEGDVLELAAWLATKSGALEIWATDFHELADTDKERKLEGLWGKKLGRDERPGGPRVQEAYTAGWVVAVLSDLQDRLVARDLVRFLENAAKASVSLEDREGYGSRLLLPRALRSAIGPTSQEKVRETEEEIIDLKPVFAKFRANSNLTKAPINQEAILEIGLTLEDIDILRLHGIILGDAPPYEVPELFRMGLGLKHVGARHSVLGTRRRAKQRFSQRTN